MPDIIFRWNDIIDILVVTTLIYYILSWLQGTRAIQVIQGILLILIIYLVGWYLELHTIEWLFDKFAAVIAMMLIIIFQPELRRTLERFGRGKLLSSMGFSAGHKGAWFVRHLIRAIETFSETKTGAIIVIERNTGLSEYVESGIRLDAIISTELLLSIFSVKSPMHDGAVIIQGDRIVAAGCLLPLSESRLLDKRLGTRHRAAIGITEVSDAVVIVVSERMETISIAENGYLTRSLSRDMLEEKILHLFEPASTKSEILPWSFIWKKRAEK
ncbi:MAG: diadenylate cyclase CdaA [Candidatus Saganbacteria bacterium]|nr:diadenylate cyclase CdaA [Candidatus Saganbacteria bacterium]